MPIRSRDVVLVGALLLIAATLRLFLTRFEPSIDTDSFQYLTLGKSLRLGTGFVSDGAHYPDVIRPPIYPLLIAGALHLTQDLELAGRLVSLLLGSLTIVPIFWLSRRMFGEGPAFISALLASIHPRLTESSVRILTDASFLFVLATSLALGWLALEKKRARCFFLVGACFGLSYLTRQVGVLFFLGYFVLAAGLVCSSSGASGRSLVRVGGLGLGFLVILVPYLVFVHGLAGRWMEPSSAFSNAMAWSEVVAREKASAGDLPGEGMPEELRLVEATHHGLSPDGTEICQWQGTLDPPRLGDIDGESGSDPGEWAASVNRLLNSGLPTLLTPLLILYSLYGLLHTAWTRDSARKHSYLAMMFVIGPLFVVLAGHLETRWLAPSAAMACIWGGEGLTKLAGFCRQSAVQTLPRFLWPLFKERIVVVALVLLFVVGAAPQFQASHLAHAANRVPEKEVGEWLKENRPGALIMSRKPDFSFYAGSRYLSLPFASYDEILRFARAKGADVLVLDELQTTERGPHLSFLLQEDASAPGLRRLRTWDSVEGRRMVAYEFESSRDDQD